MMRQPVAPDAAPPVKLGDDIIARLHKHADDARARWVEASCIASELISVKPKKVKKRAIYAAIAQEIGLATATITQWVNVYEVIENLIDEYSFFGFEHFRAIMATAKKRNADIADEAARWAATADDFGGRVVPVDRLRAALANPDAAQTLDAPRSVKTLDRLGRAVVAHDKALSAGDAGVAPGQREAWARVMAEHEAYAEKYGGWE